MSGTFAGALDAIFRTCLVMVEWFNWLLPFVMFVLVAEQTAATGMEPMLLMGALLLVLGLSTLIAMAVCTVVVAIRAQEPLWKVVKAYQPLFMTTVATGSSMAVIPWIISLLSRRLRFNALAVEMIVPLQSVILRAGSIIVYVAGTIFIAQLYGRELDIEELIFIGIASSLLAVAAAGVSGPAMFAQIGVLCGYLKLPFEAAFVLFMALDTVIHQARTLSNVFTITAATAMIAPKQARQENIQDNATTMLNGTRETVV